MRIGTVVAIRLSPADLMSAIDVVKRTGNFFPGMSLSGAVALSMSIVFEEMRRQGKVPRRDGFEYASMIADFPTKKNTKAKRAFADQTYNNTIAGHVPGFDTASVPAPEGLSDQEILDRQMKQVEMEESSRIGSPTNLG